MTLFVAFFIKIIVFFGDLTIWVLKRCLLVLDNILNFFAGVFLRIKDKFSDLLTGNRKFRDVTLFIGGLTFSVFFVYLPVSLIIWYKSLPQPTLLQTQATANKSTRILDRQGRLLYEIYVDKRYVPVDLKEIPDHVIKATLAIEDHEFYSHNGIRLQSIVRAAQQTFLEDNIQGGSTLTQQLVKNVLLSPEQTWTRKIKEAVLSIMVEQKYTKNEILEMYMNNVPYGGTAWGIESASTKFFGKSVTELSLGEAAFLAGLPSAPTSYSPFTSDKDLWKVRQRMVLDRMVLLDYITQQDADNAYNEELVFVPQVDYIKAPHFVDYVREVLNKRYGRREVDFGGLTVVTTLDLDFQEKVQEIVKTEVEANKYLNLSNGAALVLGARDRDILAYVGSKDYFQEGWGAFDVITSFRQPGSSIKPLTYALALEKGYTTVSPILDAPITYQFKGGPSYSPVNYDGKYHGYVTLRKSLANSYNIPAVKLASIVGPDNIVAFGKDLGLAGWEVDGNYGLSVTLGGRETRLHDLTNVYATFASEGMYKDVNPFLSVKDVDGTELYKPTEYTQKMDPKIAYLITSILSDNNARTPAFGANSQLYIPGYSVAVKTGTTDLKRDNYAIGYTKSFVVGVWVGNNNNEPMNPGVSSGLTGASPIWNKIIHLIVDGKQNEPFNVPTGIETNSDKSCGISDVFVQGSSPKNLCPPKVKEDKSKDKKDDKSD